MDVNITNEIKIALDKLNFSFNDIKKMIINAINARFGELDDKWLKLFYDAIEFAWFLFTFNYIRLYF